ncbi:hypothetical protein BYT27DRAFT_7260408 [Phlegmacium glaucopus]|nr:hypothetical protein BYT27DRAFT_7260408 [Phlegmacium glaucopus]
MSVLLKYDHAAGGNNALTKLPVPEIWQASGHSDEGHQNMQDNNDALAELPAPDIQQTLGHLDAKGHPNIHANSTVAESFPAIPDNEDIDHNNHGTGWSLAPLDSKVFSPKLYLELIFFQLCQLNITAVRITQTMILLAFTYTTIHAEIMMFGENFGFNFSFNFDDIDF